MWNDRGGRTHFFQRGECAFLTQCRTVGIALAFYGAHLVENVTVGRPAGKPDFKLVGVAITLEGEGVEQ